LKEYNLNLVYLTVPRRPWCFSPPSPP